MLPQLYNQNLTAELWRELETLQKIEHRNLVRLFGFFERAADSLIVVEYVSNSSLREHLDGMHCLLLIIQLRMLVFITMIAVEVDRITRVFMKYVMFYNNSVVSIRLDLLCSIIL